MDQLDTLSEEQRVIYELIFSEKSSFLIELDWCEDEVDILTFIQNIEAEMERAKLDIVEQELILTLSKRKWFIRIDRKNINTNS